MLSTTLVGREDELAALEERFAAARAGRGGVVWITGDAGAGKSRLIREALGNIDPPTVLRGRAVDALNQAPFRPLTEAFQSAFRGIDRPDSSLGGLAVHAGTLVPAWASPEGVTSDVVSPVVVGEAAIRLLQLAADDEWAAVVLEDLHWADPETLEVVQLLADATLGAPVLTICTSRTSGAATSLIERLTRDDRGSAVALGPLDAVSIRAMVAACLEVEDPPPGLDEFLAAHSDGNPYLIEELLAGLVSSGDLRRVGGLWAVGELRATVPSSLQGSIHGRLRSLDPEVVRVLGAAALLGREFDWELLPGIAETDGRTAVDALRAAAEVGLVEVRGPAFRFRHALTREAVRGELLPPELQRLAARAWPVIERAHPGLPGPALELAADLAEVAGDRDAAVGLLVRSAHRALDRGAVATAESTARRAVRVAGDRPAAVEAERTLVDVLVAAGKVADALSIGRELSERIRAGGDDTAAFEHHLTLARAAVLAGDRGVAAEEVDAARERAGAAPGPAVTARLDVVAAHVALDGGDLATAAELAERARGAGTDQPDVVCDATLLIGRVVRAREWSGSIGLFEEAAHLAERAGLAAWHLRARQELASSAWVTGDLTRLHDLRSTAVAYGAITTVAQIDLSLADIALSTFDTAACLRAASDCVTASHRYRLAAEPVAHLWLAGAHALAGDDASMQASIDDALTSDPDDPRILGDLFGRVLLTRALVRDELDAVPGLLEQMAQHVRRAPPGTSVYPGRAPRALLHAISGDDEAVDSRADLALLAGTGGMPFFDHAVDLVDAVAAGRAGATAEAEARFTPAYEALAGSTLGAGPVHSLALFFSPAAHRDGWGDPVAWLRAAEAWFHARGFARIARRCRLLLGEVGAPVPRRGRGSTPVPEGLRALGVTSREVEVLRLVVAGSTNREIAEELVLSSKTVERHVSNLFDRTGATSRKELTDLTSGHLGTAER